MFPPLPYLLVATWSPHSSKKIFEISLALKVFTSILQGTFRMITYFNFFLFGVWLGTENLLFIVQLLVITSSTKFDASTYVENGLLVFFSSIYVKHYSEYLLGTPLSRAVFFGFFFLLRASKHVLVESLMMECDLIN
jgi:hypothetical protein